VRTKLRECCIGILILAGSVASAGAADFSMLAGPYLGQDPPGLQPEPFAEGLIGFSHSSISMSPDGMEIYWAERTRDQTTSRIFFTQRSGEGWSEPTPLFGGNVMGADCPVISPDGRSLFFNSIHPLVAGERERERLWVSERIESGWSMPQPLSETVNAFGLHWQSSVDAEGGLYFGAVPPEGGSDDDIFISRFVDGAFTLPTLHPTSTMLDETTPFIDPGGEYILISRIDGTAGHIAASFRGEDGTWTEPVALDLGDASYPVCPYVSPDGKYLFFLSRAKVYWVDAQVIDAARIEQETPNP
jgi:hypothetical protein